MIFIAILMITTLAIAGTAAYFSIVGLAEIFAGIMIPVIIMGSALEVGKLVATSFLFRFRHRASFLLKTYLLTAIFLLMVITSAGIFGMLASGYQSDILPTKQMEQQIVLLDEEKNEILQLKEERLDRKKQIDADIASLPNNYITGRQKLMDSYGPELEQLQKDIAQYNDRIKQITLEVSNIKADKLEQESHVGPIIFIASAFGADVDDATKWLILLIIFVFDPLAVMLTIGTNIAIEERQKRKATQEELPVKK